MSDNWKTMYIDLWCAIWCGTPEEFEAEALGAGVDHAGTVAEAFRDWRMRDATALAAKDAEIAELKERVHDLQFMVDNGLGPEDLHAPQPQPPDGT